MLSGWCAKFIYHPGILNNVSSLITKSTESLPEADTLFILSFDEMSVNGRVLYGAGLDQGTSDSYKRFGRKIEATCVF